MKSLDLLFLGLVLSLILVPSMDAFALNIPPTRAFSNVITDNGTLKANNYNGTFQISGIGISVNSSNINHKIILKVINKGTNASSTNCPSGKFFDQYSNSTGIFSCNTPNGGNGQENTTVTNIGHNGPFKQYNSTDHGNLEFYGITAGKGISITQNLTDNSISATLEAFTKSCSMGQFFNTFDNTTGIYGCSSASGSSTQIYDNMSNIGNGEGSIYAGNNTKTSFQFKTIKGGTNVVITNNTSDITIGLTGLLSSALLSLNGDTSSAQIINSANTNHITVTNSGANHSIDIAFKTNNITCSVGNFISSYSNTTGIYTCTTQNLTDTNTAQGLNVGGGQASIYAGRQNATQIQLKTISILGSGSITNGTNLITINTKTYQNNTGQNIGKGTNSKGPYSGISSSILQFKNMTAGSGISISGNTSDITITNTGLISGVTQLNGFTGKVNITTDSGNHTITNSSGTIKIGNGVNIIIKNGANQTVTKPFGISKLIDTLSFIVGSVDTSKRLAFSDAGMTTGVTTTIRNNATTSQGINIPATRESETLAIRPALNSSAPSDPTGTTSTSGVMTGLLLGFTPQVTGRVQIVIEGDLSSLLAADGVKVDARTGTGNAPTNAAALSGTVCGKAVQINSASAVAYLYPFTLTCQVTGLTVGTHIWIELGEYAITASTASVKNLSLTIIEI